MAELILASEAWLDEVWAYRQECLDAGSSMDGCGPLRRCETPAQWLAETQRYTRKETLPEGMVVATQFLYVEQEAHQLLGMIQVRHYFNEYLEKYAGHIGYSVRPAQRRRGHAKQMLRACLPFCRELGLKRVLVSCEDTNEASRRTILSAGGVYESTVYCPEHQCSLERYWIEL